MVKCASGYDKEKLFTALKEDSSILIPTIPRRKYPTVLLKNVPNSISNDELLKIFEEQNPEITVSEETWKDVKVRFTLKKFQRERSVVIEVHPAVRKRILNFGRIKVMWNMCKTEDFVVLNRCFKCLGYHRNLDCRSPLACYCCSGEHKSSECDKKEVQVCINCIIFNKKTKNATKKVDVNHKPFSGTCPSHTFMMNLAASKIYYG
ncbi:uncharacterized protein LOC118184886 [Stegodyphus dumicola]|uniref:uncharacterized protein LOC118184886 n=1 Tax=Stegodyphus dumicola TaxID=202533 RepID=UPI0015A95B81|nr:uncharacterized protein LOC118184886 [Stegodyphus dumicola]